MPSFTGKTFANFYKNILSTAQPANTGIDSSAARVQDGEGSNSAIFLSDDQLIVQPVNDDTTAAFRVRTVSGDNPFIVDATNQVVKAGASNANVLTLYKEMGLYDFTPAAGYHYPLVANMMHFETAFAADTDWGNGTDPATTLDVSGLTAQENAIAVYWYLDDDITLDSVRFMATADGTDVLGFHLLSYAVDTTTNYGDLSGGTVQASGGLISAAATTIRTGTLTLDSEDIDSGRVVIGFVESDSTTDLSVHFNIKYHIR